MSQLFRRAHPHGTAALFTTREYVGSPRPRNGLNTKPMGVELVRGDRGEIYCIINIHDTKFAVVDGLLISTKDRNGPSDCLHEREIMPLSQVQLRLDV